MAIISVLTRDYVVFFFFKQKTAYEMRISDWSSDVCSSDLKITYASIGNGTPHYLAMEWAKAMAGIDLVHVPYKGVAPALADVVGGQEIGRASCRARVCQYV